LQFLRRLSLNLGAKPGHRAKAGNLVGRGFDPRLKDESLLLRELDGVADKLDGQRIEADWVRAPDQSAMTSSAR
jgi:hypothetical protein